MKDKINIKDKSKNKNVIIDGDKFQKEYKHQYRKELITDLVQGILLLVIACSGLFFDSKLLLELIIYIFPIFILTYAVNLFWMGIGTLKYKISQSIIFFIQSLLFILFAIYIILNPIGSLGYVLVIIGSIIIINALIKMLYFPNYFPVTSFIGGGILILFADALINFFYSIAMVILLILGVSKISKFIYSIKHK